jgi:hypothetical protein
MDGDKQNCTIGNLELVTVRRNSEHAYEKGLIHIEKVQAENNPISKFTNDQVLQLRELFAKGKTSVARIMREHEVCRTTVNWLLRGRSYSTVVGGFEEKCNDILYLNPYNRRRKF